MMSASRQASTHGANVSPSIGSYDGDPRAAQSAKTSAAYVITRPSASNETRTCKTRNRFLGAAKKLCEPRSRAARTAPAMPVAAYSTPNPVTYGRSDAQSSTYRTIVSTSSCSVNILRSIL
jgi:hypothetical protein